MIHHLVAITGGIGAGKSIVSRVLRAKGYQVYDCDSRARAIMDSDPEIKTRLRAEIHPKALSPDGTIDRRLIASVVFTDPDRPAFTAHVDIQGDIPREKKEAIIARVSRCPVCKLLRSPADVIVS